MSSQRSDSTTRGPTEIPEAVQAQLELNVSLVNEARARRDRLPAGLVERMASTSARQDFDLMVSALTFMQPETRERIGYCVGVLLDLVREVSQPQVPGPQGSALDLPESMAAGCRPVGPVRLSVAR